MSQLPRYNDYVATGGQSDGTVWLRNGGAESCYFLESSDSGYAKTFLADIQYSADGDATKTIYVGQDGRRWSPVALPLWGGPDGRTPGIPVKAVSEL